MENEDVQSDDLWKRDERLWLVAIVNNTEINNRKRWAVDYLYSTLDWAIEIADDEEMMIRYIKKALVESKIALAHRQGFMDGLNAE